ncbi:LPS biosynthesis protein [Thalassotalea loyana]|uniref:LPS biosynthesis protein n=2 Tax=Thalassotalea loyana TaxID=280483 RepID=A0ABQ6HGL1_9GAMM|nr:LPS biosynthesis protein [Thalassotalea loyana]
MDFEMKAYLATQMQKQLSLQNDDEIDLAELWKAIWSGKLIIIFITLCFAIASIVFALSQPNIYKSSVLLAPVSSEGGVGGLAGLAGQFGGLASLAGINLGSTGTDKTALALEVIKSRKFIQSFIQKYNLLVPLMATKGWEMSSNTIVYDGELYDFVSKTWVRNVKPPKQPQPSLWEAYMEFSEILSVSQDKATSMVTIELEHYSPYLAKQWVELLVREINKTIKEQDQAEAQESINYLKTQLEETNVANMHSVFYQLIEEQSKNMMLTQVKEEYVLKTIDPAQVAEEKAKPKRALIVVLGTLFGGMLAVLFVLVRYFTKSKSSAKPKQELTTSESK